MKAKIKILIAEDEGIVRMSLKCLLQTNNEFEVVAEAANGRDVIRALKNSIPDIVLLDLKMPVLNGCQTLEIINKRFKDVKVIILSSYDDFDVIIDLLSKGAKGFVPKNSSHDLLVTTIYEVYKNGKYFDKQVSEAIFNGLFKGKSINPLFDEVALTESENKIMKEICNGLTNKEIADRINISPSTVDYHKKNIYRKTKSRSVCELMKYAYKNGLIMASQSN